MSIKFQGANYDAVRSVKRIKVETDGRCTVFDKHSNRLLRMRTYSHQGTLVQMSFLSSQDFDLLCSDIVTMMGWDEQIP